MAMFLVDVTGCMSTIVPIDSQYQTRAKKIAVSDEGFSADRNAFVWIGYRYNES